ncbi:MAG: 2,3-bisphosphoglycerate-independent phosphoglycerate mutase [Candidatus Sungbacteria bacterium]|nr:2,3-bisphosphoglycerate-independent phosphoglycerate mutase [Candidatus Sungbacteria bacterium]
MTKPKPLILVILDGFGISTEKTGNPVEVAKKPVWQELEKKFPFTLLQASGVAVGLPWGESGNSEVGHLTIGAGRVIYHHLPRIVYSIYDGSFFKNKAFLQATAHVKTHGSRLHIAGLVSSGSVHSYIDHLYALLDTAERENVPEVFIHIFTDGKDAYPQEGAKFIGMLEERMKKEWPHAHLASVIGRFFALDRDNNWDRVKKAYDLLTIGAGEKITSIPQHIAASYAQNITDEFVEPAIVVGDDKNPVGVIRENDALIFSDFREDSMREISRAFADAEFSQFPREPIKNLRVVTMTEYQKGTEALPAFPTLDVTWPLTRVLSDSGLSHLHIAETQKYAHVTYFLNGGREEPFPHEERILIPSLVAAHYDEMPEMRARDITNKILERFNDYDVIIANLANTDMVGHSGNFEAAVHAIETVDECLGELLNAVMNSGALLVITADHGNIERKRNIITGEASTKHSVNPVPLFLVSRELRREKLRTEEEILQKKSEIDGILTDIAPTLLEILGIKKPQEMTGKSLLSILLSR